MPDFNIFFEVKSTDDYDDENNKLFSELIGKKVLVAIGKPPELGEWGCGEPYGLQTVFPSQEWHDSVAWEYKDMFLECDDCGRISVMNEVFSTMKDAC